MSGSDTSAVPSRLSIPLSWCTWQNFKVVRLALLGHHRRRRVAVGLDLVALPVSLLGIALVVIVLDMNPEIEHPAFQLLVEHLPDVPERLFRMVPRCVGRLLVVALRHDEGIGPGIVPVRRTNGQPGRSSGTGGAGSS